MSQSKSSFNFLLLGKTGVGKSATGNSLTKRSTAFQTSGRMNSCTQEPRLECGRFQNYDIKVVDTPGLMDTQVGMPDTLNKICNAMALLPDGFDALLLVLKYGDRCTKEVVEVFTALRAMFGDVFAKEYCIIVMTHGEQFDMQDEEDRPNTLDDYCKEIREPPELLSLLVDCEYRVVMFRNKNKATYEESVLSILHFAQTRTHRSQRYTRDIFAKFAIERNKYVISLKLPQLIPPIQEKLSFLKEELEKAIESPDANSDLEIERTAQQLLDTIEVESNGTSLMDNLKDDVKRIIISVKTLSSRKQERQQKLRKLNDLVETIKHPPSKKAVILTGLVTVAFAATSAALTVGTLFNPLIGVMAGANIANTHIWRKAFEASHTSFQEEQKRYERALEERDQINKDLKQ